MVGLRMLHSKEKLSSKFLDALLAHIDDAVLVMSPDGVIARSNAAAVELLGFPADELVGRHARLILPKQWWPYWDSRLAELRQGNTVHGMSVRQHKDGHLVDVEFKTVGIFDSDEIFIGYFNIFKDLKKKDAEELANTFLATLVRASPDAILSTSIDLRVRTWNAAAEALLGVASDEAIGSALEQYIPQLQPVMVEFSPPQLEVATIRRFETTVVNKNGGTTPVSIVVCPILNSAGVPTGWFVSCTDITERRKAEENTRIIMGELSHRAKNLLTVITAMATNSAHTESSRSSFEIDFSERLHGLARSHDLLVQSNWNGAWLHRLATEQLRPFVGLAQNRLAINGPDLNLRPDATQCLGLAFHELATNATKYGALANPMGIISIDIVDDGADHVLTWSERGGTEVKTPIHEGFGMVVIRDMITDTFGSEATLSLNPEGLVWSARLPARFIARPGSSDSM